MRPGGPAPPRAPVPLAGGRPGRRPAARSPPRHGVRQLLGVDAAAAPAAARRGEEPLAAAAREAAAPDRGGRRRRAARARPRPRPARGHHGQRHGLPRRVGHRRGHPGRALSPAGGDRGGPRAVADLPGCGRPAAGPAGAHSAGERQPDPVRPATQLRAPRAGGARRVRALGHRAPVPGRPGEGGTGLRRRLPCDAAFRDAFGSPAPGGPVALVTGANAHDWGRGDRFTWCAAADPSQGWPTSPLPR